MKKIVILLLSMMSAFLIFSACSTSVSAGKNECEHSWGSWIVSEEATCLKEGTQIHICSKCQSSESQLIAKSDHTPVTDKGVEATCTTTGLTEGSHCSVCETVLVEQQTIPAKGHTPVTDEAVEATCTTTGLTEGSHCSRCNETLVTQTTVGALGHVEVIDNAVAATCTTDGKTEGKHCSRCNETLVAQTTVRKHHTMVDGVCLNCYYPYIPIDSVEDLQSITTSSTYLSGNYILVCDINLNGAEWTPIGSFDNRFTGCFNGNGFKISNFKITKYTQYAGFFGYNEGIIKNLSIEDIVINISSYQQSSTIVGGLVGNNYKGDISNCSIKGTISINTVSSSDIGGIVGLNSGNITGCQSNVSISVTSTGKCDIGGLIGYNRSVVIRSSSNSKIITKTSEDVCTGGLIGLSYISSKVTDCYSVGDITSTSTNGDSTVGGLIGESYATVELCHSSCHVSVSDTSDSWNNIRSGGLIGWSYSTTVSKSYSTADVSITSNNESWVTAGGLCGLNYKATITDCYSTGNLTIEDAYISYVGGLSGENEGSLINSYSTGNIDVSSKYEMHIGGLCGISNGAIVNCYAVGQIFGASTSSYQCTYSIGGVVGTAEGTLMNNYRLDNQHFEITQNATTTYNPTNSIGDTVSLNDIQTIEFQTNILGWNTEIWHCTNGQHPTLN